MNASLHYKCKAKDMKLFIDIIACFQCLLMASHCYCSWLLGRHVDCEERLAVKKLVLVLIRFIFMPIIQLFLFEPMIFKKSEPTIPFSYSIPHCRVCVE